MGSAEFAHEEPGYRPWRRDLSHPPVSRSYWEWPIPGQYRGGADAPPPATTAASGPFGGLPARRPGVAFLAPPDPADGPAGPKPELPAASSGGGGPNLMVLQKVLRGLRSLG